MPTKGFRWIGELVDHGAYSNDSVGEMFSSLGDAEIALQSWFIFGDTYQQEHTLPNGEKSSALMPGLTEGAEIWLYSLGRVAKIEDLRNALDVPMLEVYRENGPDRIVRIGPRGGTRAVRP